LEIKLGKDEVVQIEIAHSSCPIEEIADVKLCLHVGGFERVRHKIQVNRIISAKAERWLKRLLGEEA
jgi:hypothetical protein